MHYKPSGVCCTGIDIDTEGSIIKEVKFTNGCSGNTQGIARLVQGMEIDEAVKRLSGIRCGSKPSSCPDQLAKALIQIRNEAV
ncbi:MAG: TIGR03905 family TSCPD domain-containing protein [Lachnospiraceae bacterium]|nr:TIGR03905 family TSCPD domain-containing protein [Lachnospiraceae bacterium]